MPSPQNVISISAHDNVNHLSRAAAATDCFTCAKCYNGEMSNTIEKNSPNKLQTQFSDDVRMLDNGSLCIVERPCVALNVLHVVLDCGDASIKSIFKSCLDSAEINRIGNDQRINRKGVEVDRHCEALGNAKAHDLLEARDDSFAFGIATDGRPLARLRIIT